ncbi:response regulator [Halomonas piscis]|uniref:Response regulator n=1 Tax=Halomonas piscis TaxID=3031727 RepID=A0ABY9YWV4_9GAMM|nr:response regulator [Halomonas piscis]WNK19353.1 response regulator [Halomonas piscis]
MTHFVTAPDSALVLVIEDEQALRDDIADELREAGYRTSVASDGQQALDLLSKAPPDLLLCDITMPGMDGYELLDAVRTRHPTLATAPFIFLTALAGPNEVVRGKLQGADDYLVKPIDYDLMLATVEAHLRQVKRLYRHHRDELSTLRTAVGELSGSGATQALDLITLGVVLLDLQGRPVRVNRAARSLADDADVIHLRDTGIQALDTPSNRALQQGLDEARAAAMAGKDRVVGAMLACQHQPASVSALICALPGEPINGHSGQPGAVVFLSPSHQRRRASETLLMELFDLTPTEARVAGALAGGARKADIAGELGISPTTVAFHMRNLFDKTRTHRQADLIALILAGPMMVNSE